MSKTVSLEEKLRAVRTYLNSNKSLRAVAQQYKISYRTLSYWVNQYKRTGIKGLIERKARKNSLSKELETQIMFLKEKNPGLSISQAQELFNKKKIGLSRRIIWQVWHRYGLSKQTFHEPMRPFCTQDTEAKNGMKRAQHAIQKGDMKEAARILNELPCLPVNPTIIREIPEKYLSPRRRLDLLVFEFASLSMPQRLSMARRIGRLLESKGFIYSSIFANLHEVIALDWMGEPEKKVVVLTSLTKKVRHMKNSALRFLLYLNQALTYCDLLQIDRALAIVKKCRRLVYRLPFAYYQDSFAALMTSLGKYADAAHFYRKALENSTDERKIAEYDLNIALCQCVMSGEYHKHGGVLRKAIELRNAPGFGSAYSFIEAQMSFGQGNLVQAREFYLETLRNATKNQLYSWLYVASVGLAAVANALNKQSEAKTYVKKYLPLIKKHKLMGEALVMKQLTGSQESVPKKLQFKPTLYLLNLLVRAQQTGNTKDYRKALTFARKQQLVGLFHRWIVFFPKPVLRLVDQGKPTGLPRTILRFPIFNQQMPVYHVKFLGDVVISKHNRYVRAKLSPTETAFLIHLALRAGSPGKAIAAKQLYANFWRHSTSPRDRLLHLLTHIKKRLKISGHLLTVSSASGETRLLNRGVYITTDYAEFETLLAQVKTLQRADEWSYVRRDYLRAFALLRGEPLGKMYDDWSEHLRRTIMMRVENEATNFTNGCLHNNDKHDACRILVRVQTIAPYSQTVRQLLKQVTQ